MSTAAIAERPPAPELSAPTTIAEQEQQLLHQPALDRLALVHALNRPAATDLQPGHIVSSPYAARAHTLDLARVPAASALFARALQVLAPATGAYATAPYAEAFDFGAVFAELRRLVADEAAGDGERGWPRTSFYVVAFRSELRAGIDSARLGELDAASHAEAVASGGLLKYWFGVPDGERRNLATCFWHSREDAFEGGKGPEHRKARNAATMYERIDFETRRLTVEEGVKGWFFEDWKNGSSH